MTSFPLPDLINESDAWEAPAEFTKAGRLNKGGESLLYTTFKPISAIEETRSGHGDLIAMITYECIEDIKCSVIGEIPTIKGLNELQLLKMRVIRDFLHHEFIRDVGNGTEFLYRASQLIAKDYYDFPPSMQDAWLFPSVAKKQDHNVAFRPEKAHQKLRLTGIIISTLDVKEDEIKHYDHFVIPSVRDDKSLRYIWKAHPEYGKIFEELNGSKSGS